MTDNVPVRAATAPELAKFRSAGDFTKLGLAIEHPVTVYSARVNEVFTTWDGTVQVTYDGASGTIGNVKIGMTVLVSAVGYGKSEKGMTRIRQLPTSDTLYIGLSSDIRFTDNDYITVIDSFALWQRDAINAGVDALEHTVYMDYDIEFGNLLNGGVIARIGPLVSVLKLVAGTVTFAPPDPSLSECYDGATIVSYEYDAPGAASTSGMTTTSPSWTYDTAGEYRWSCTITDSLGRETIAYRRVFVDPTPISFTLESCGASYDDGDWSFEVTCYADVARSEVRDRAFVTLFADEETYNGVKGSIGKLAGYENIICAGWIDGESIVYNFENHEVTFSVRGPGWWLSKLRAYPFELQDTSIATTTWKQIQEMTVDKALAQILYWTSTAPLVMDCFFTGDLTRFKILPLPSGDVLSQLHAIAFDKIFAKPLVNNYGQLFVEVDTQIIDSASKAALPVVMDITTADWEGELNIEPITSSRTALVELAAVSDYDGTTSLQIYSRAPGTVGKQYGGITSYNNYFIVDQDECNRIAGCLLAMENNPFEPLEIPFATNNRLIDIAPRMVCTLSLAEGDTVRGIVLSAARLIPRNIELDYDKENFVLSTVVTFEFEVIGEDGVIYTPPDVETDNLDTGIGDIGDLDFPGLDDWFPPVVPPDVTNPCDGVMSNWFSITFSPSVIYGSTESQRIAKAYFPCMLRSTGSRIEMNLAFHGDAADHFAVYAIFDGARVLSASLSPNKKIAYFTPASNTQVDGFEIEIEAGVGSEIGGYSIGKILETGISHAEFTGEIWTTTKVQDGQYYAIEPLSGHFYRNDQPTKIQYNWDGAGNKNEENGMGWTPYSGAFGAFVTSPNNFPALFYSPKPGAKGAETYCIAFFLGTIFQQSPAPSNTSFLALVPGYTGSMRFALREAFVLGRYINIGTCTLFDVCAIEAV